MSSHADLTRMLAEADARHAERRKRRKPTTSEVYARLGMSDVLSPKVKRKAKDVVWVEEVKERRKEVIAQEEALTESDLSDLIGSDDF